SWRDYARTFFSAVTAQARDAGVRDVGELYRLLVVAETDELRVLVRGTPAQPFLDEHNARMFDSVRSVTSAAVGSLQYVTNPSAAPLSVRRWIASGDRGVLFLPYAAGQIAALRNTISAWMRLGIYEAMNRDRAMPGREERPRPLWFVVDELDALGPIDGLKDALARLRKFDARCVLGFQSIAQVSSTYGQGEAHTIVENCSNTLILRCSASEGGGTAKFASQLIGDREVRRITVSRSRRATEFLGTTTRSEHVSIEPTLLPSQIERLPDLRGYLKHASSGSWRRVELDPDAASGPVPRALDAGLEHE
ncbi:MAG: type IV secretion system DNA-binding domain-containing protein, partial [Gammaproteobacteria bacterium]|nr:type IV secretion system DNA-binding domain-containing protein [Gammaproteobacteria bacterium]